MKAKIGPFILAILLTAVSAIPALAGAKAGGAPKPVEPSLSGAAVYKANCIRCHGEPRKFSDRAMKTIMRHMRVRANMTEQETQVVLEYLTK